MNIKILDSWLREYLKTEAKAEKIAEVLSLTSVSVERLERIGQDFIYDIEITTNRPDLMSIIGLAREAAAVLSQAGVTAKFDLPKFKETNGSGKLDVEITIDPKLVNRICAVALEVTIAESPKLIQERLLAAGINPHNNLVDVTNYVMREVGHPMHAFDYEKLVKFGKFIIREARPGEKIIDLHGEEHTLAGGDIVADDGIGTIIDLLGVIGTQNSSVDDNTKRVLLFVDDNDPVRIRKTSMSLAIRTEAAVLNEKGVDPELSDDAVARGVELLKEIANAKVISEFTDIYPNKFEPKTVEVTEAKINSVIGVEVPIQTSVEILEALGFATELNGDKIRATVPSWRANDVEIPEDLVEEVARVYGYFKLPSLLPPTGETQNYNRAGDIFYWEARVRSAMKYWGATEVYTYPMVAEDLLEVATKDAVTIKNPLTEDHIYMRTTLIPSLLEAARENKNRQDLKLFELANTYLKRANDLPEEKLMLGVVLKKPKVSFFEAKGIIEALFADLNIKTYEFKAPKSGSVGADVYIDKDFLGQVEQLEEDIVDFELDFEILFKHANLKKIYKPGSHFPAAYEDLRFEIDETIPYEKIVRAISQSSELVHNVSLLDVYKNKKTFRITYQSDEKNLTSEEITEIREKIISALKKSFKADPA